MDIKEELHRLKNVFQIIGDREYNSIPMEKLGTYDVDDAAFRAGYALAYHIAVHHVDKVLKEVEDADTNKC